ncbi:MAG: polysaccharide pyruvyl transferase family protein [Methylibium petroleiphilum]|nr:polysaccharide pyruvyl transferase family protein [Methylibium petroleiphilum]
MRGELARHVPSGGAARTGHRLLIVPSDPWTLIGAKGDEAMMQSVVGRLRQQLPALEVGVVTATAAAQDAARQLGFLPVDAWAGSLTEGLRRIDEFAPDMMVVLGADVLDGYYSPLTAARMLLTAQAAARSGTRVSILGFSFNARPHRLLKSVFDSLDASISVNLRDRLSRERFQRFTSARSQLVSDSAFMLLPDVRQAEVERVGSWAARSRDAGHVVLGFNVHPMLIRSATPAQVAGLVDSAIAALREVCKRRPVALLLLSHDYRGNDGDDVCLAPIANAMSALMPDRVLYPTAKFTAAQLKALAGSTDGVVTGRMHLAIASLGMERPVAALTYQDKFQGLFAHFDYPERFLLDPQGAADPRRLAAMIEDFVDQLPTLTTTVMQRLPDVQRASALNLSALTA